MSIGDGTLSSPPHARLAKLPRKPGEKPQETAVAVNPRDPRNAIVSYHQAVGEGSDHHPDVRVEAHVAWTADGGETWTVADDTTHPGYRMSIDTEVVFDLEGRAYLVYLGMEDMSLATRHGEYVLRSLDGGRTWEGPVALAERPGDEELLEHMPKMAADVDPGSPYAGNVYVVWDRIRADRSEEMVIVRSSDGGESWSAPKVIGTHASTTLPSVAVGPDGAVYVLFAEAVAGDWRSPEWKLMVEVSRDGGETFGDPVHVADTRCVMFGLPTFPRVCWLPSIGVDREGRAFAAWGDKRDGDSDILASTSTDGGRSWAEPVRVNDDPESNGKDQALHSLAVDPTDGAAYVLFYDRRDDPENLLATMTLACSTDGGRTFANYAWSHSPSDPRETALGDYIGIDAFDGRVYGAWSEGVADEDQAAPTKVVDYGGGVVLEEGQWPAGPAAIRVGIADFRESI